MEAIRNAIMHGAEAGKLREYVRENGGDGLAGLTRLADRHSADSEAELMKLLAGAVVTVPRSLVERGR